MPKLKYILLLQVIFLLTGYAVRKNGRDADYEYRNLLMYCQTPREVYGHLCVRGIIYRDSTLNSAEKLRFFDNDSIEMRSDGRLVYTQYLNCKRGEIIYRYYKYGTVEREVYSIDMEMGQIHFRDYHKYADKDIENTGYLSVPDSIPYLLKDDLGEYFRVGVIKETRGEELLSETYLLWRSAEDCNTGQNGDWIGKRAYDKDGNISQIDKYAKGCISSWLYYPNGQLSDFGMSKLIYSALFPTCHVSYDSLGNKTNEMSWENLFPEWGRGYNDTFSVGTIREYYQSGGLKSLTKKKSFCESGEYRCGTWIYYDERGKILKTEQYGNCYNFKLEEKYNDDNFSEDKN